ncbi:hypothetical protein [Pseudomonas sp. Teo4]|uniref:hypothetical protein n=1 Tax=Pseudomonas sp. Teo4 TaxID=3064528 RepID=UPI002ABC27CE|nr:hypothetical protein [Pseudomonas sp. Teo4]MDZ3993099.1 hypothetical protein [Pseudomonas sp. Teo4]
MTLPDELFDAITPEPTEVSSIDDEDLACARRCLSAGLADADAPVDWLNQASNALRAKLAEDAQWQQLLPPGLAEHAEHIESADSLWRSALDTALEVQARVYQDLLLLGSLPDSYPERLREVRREQHLQRLLKSFGDAAPTEQVLAPWLALRTRRQAAQQSIQEALAAQPGPWEGVLGQLETAIGEAMSAEASLQVLEGQLSQQDHTQLFAPAADQSVQWLEARAGEQVLPGVWVVVQSSAWRAGLQHTPMAAWVHGDGGGLVCLHDQAMLCERLELTLSVAHLPAFGQLADVDAKVQLAPASDGLTGMVKSLLDHWNGQLMAEQETHAEPEPLSAEQDAERRQDLARAALSIPADTCRQSAVMVVERLWAADTLAQHMPDWLLNRSDAERHAYAAQLSGYQQSAIDLEGWLEEQVQPFATFAGERLCAQVKSDLGIELGSDTVLLHRPVSVNHYWLAPGTGLEPSPGGDFGFSAEPLESPGPAFSWVASDEWEDVTVAQLACEGFDASDDSEKQRLEMAQWKVAGISASYLSRTLVKLDPLKHFEQAVFAAFAPEQSKDVQRLRRPYVLELKLLASSTRWRRDLSVQASRMVMEAADALSHDELVRAGMRLHWLTIHSGQEQGKEAKGAGALVDIATGLTVLYLPGAPKGNTLIERESLEQALDYLRLAIRTRTDMAEYIARRCSNEPARLLSYFRQAATKGYAGYLRAPEAIDHLVSLQLKERCARLIDQARQQGRSQVGIRIDGDRSAHERHVGYLRAGLALVPGINVAIALQDIEHSAQAIGQAWRAKDAEALGWGAIGVAGGVIDILLTAVPVAGGLWSLRRAARLRIRQLHVSRPLAGYEAHLKLRGASRLEGQNEGIWTLDGQQYIRQDGRVYAVYRRAGESTLRLKATATRRYEAPVRLDGGRWVLHAQVGLRGGGGKLSEAEALFKHWGPSSRHPGFAGVSRERALARGRRVLAEYDFRGSQQEAEFAISYLADGAPPDWSRAYRTGAGGSGGASGTGAVAAQPWQRLRWNIGTDDIVNSSGSYGGEVRVRIGNASAIPVPGVRIEGNYYPILNGSASSRVRFIAQPGTPPARLRDLDALIEQGRGPVRVELGADTVTAPQVLGGFTETFSARLARRYPQMNPHARSAMGEALYQNALRRSGWSSISLQELERWIDDVGSEPLQVVNERVVRALAFNMDQQINIGHYNEWRWSLADTEAFALRNAIGLEAMQPFQESMTRLLTARGYLVIEQGAHHGRYVAIFLRPGQRHVYVLLQHQHMGQMSLMGRNGMVQLGDVWLDELLSRVNLRAASAMRSARQQGLLHPIVGGLHLDGPNTTELVWQRIRLSLGNDQVVPPGRSWRQSARDLLATDQELVPHSGLYGRAGDTLAHGVSIERRWVPIFPVEGTSNILLTRSQRLAAPLSFDDLERCIRQSYGEQPWLVVRSQQGWSVRRALFMLNLDRQVTRARPGLTQQSA